MDEEKGIFEISFLYIDNLLLPSNELIPRPEGEKFYGSSRACPLNVCRNNPLPFKGEGRVRVDHFL